MSNIYAVVTNGVVTNIVQWNGESDWAPPEGSDAVPVPLGTFVDIGYTWDGTKFSAPAIM